MFRNKYQEPLYSLRCVKKLKVKFELLPYEINLYFVINFENLSTYPFLTANNGGDQQINSLKSKVYYIQKKRLEKTESMQKTIRSKVKIEARNLGNLDWLADFGRLSLISRPSEHF